MKNKNGFTLVELLAVILILGIIALIAVPVVSNIINESKNNASIRSIESYIEATEKSSVKSLLNPNNFVKNSGVYTTEELKGNIDIKGDVPTEGWIKVQDGKVIDYSLKINDKIINYDSATEKPILSKDDGVKEKPTDGVKNIFSLGDVVYFNPVDDTKCDASVYSKYGTSEFDKTKIGNCYRWRLLTMNDTASNQKIDIQLDHSIKNYIGWSGTTNSMSGPVPIFNDLNSLTSNWVKLDGINYSYNSSLSSYNYGTLVIENGVCKSHSAIKGITRARIITGEEITSITNSFVSENNTLSKKWKLSSSNSDFYYLSQTAYDIGTQNKSTSNLSINTKLSWLFENTKFDANDNSNSTLNVYDELSYGYWTISPCSNNQYHAWMLGWNGRFSTSNVTNITGYGIRPLINVEKSKLTY